MTSKEVEVILMLQLVFALFELLSKLEHNVFDNWTYFFRSDMSSDMTVSQEEVIILISDAPNPSRLCT